MRLMMAGLDYTTAGMDIRDVFSPDPAQQRQALGDMMRDGIAACALLATCNRTELYISHRADAPPDCIAILCRVLGREPQQYRQHFVERYERQAVEHLMRVSAGMLSSVPGDDHILTQVRTAIETARDARTADPFLEALFRAAITAGKKVKTSAGPARDGASVARRAVAEMEKRLHPLPGRRILVVGNGVIGRLTAAELAAKGCTVSVTVRDPRRKSELPAGCGDVDFSERYRALAGRDAVISATSSPRHTLERAELEGITALPPLFIDLAVPRDIEPSVGELPGVTLLNVDHLRGNAEEDGATQRWRAEADALILAEAERFDLWRRNRGRYASAGSGAPDFPLFVSLCGAPVLIAGGGRVAARRAEKLLGAGALVHIVSPGVSPEMTKLLERPGLRWTSEPYHPRHMEGATLVIAATDRREVNAAVGDDARRRGILVSVADRSEECTFYFPAIVRSDRLTAGLISNNGDHGMVKRAAVRIHGEMEAFEVERQGEKESEPEGSVEMNTENSRELYARAVRVIPGGVNSPVRAFGSVGGNPLFIAGAQGATVTDADGNSYIDYVCSWGPMILGHNDPHILEAAARAARDGLSFGAPCEYEVRMAETITRLAPVEMVRMVNSGTEAVMSALRLARGFTGRDRVIKFAGCYHGHADGMLVKAGSGALTGGVPDSSGVTAGTAGDTLVADYNDLDSVETLFRANPDSVAALIVEPVAANMGVVLPGPGFLEGLRALCDRYGALLVFDEVITGFRLGLGGAQQYFGVAADLATYGKIIGGGMPVGAYGGRRDIMEKIAPLGPVYQAGTLSGNPVAMAAGLAQLERLENDPDIYRRIDALTARLAVGLRQGAAEAGVPLQVNAIGSLCCAYFAPAPVTGYGEARLADTDAYARYFASMLDKGVYLAPSQFEAMFVGSVHTPEMIDRTIAAAWPKTAG